MELRGCLQFSIHVDVIDDTADGEPQALQSSQQHARCPDQLDCLETTACLTKLCSRNLLMLSWQSGKF